MMRGIRKEGEARTKSRKAVEKEAIRLSDEVGSKKSNGTARAGFLLPISLDSRIATSLNGYVYYAHII